ncbi:uncharacterized protein LOC134064364 [Sardina pilchardus]|uniref:uncharacterized protein LOC134064364 n=1 Tax=Sardina pilchardus TaxID=27697 RepID=UPI002E13E4C7
MDRVLISSKTLRDMLSQYSRGGCTEQQFREMEAEAKRTASFLSPLLQFFSCGGHQHQAPQAYRCLLAELSKSSPTCALLHPCTDLDSLLEDVSKEQSGSIVHHTALMHKLHLHCPLLWQVLCLDGLRKEVVPLIQAMYRVAKQAFDGVGGPVTCPAEPPQESALQYFPHLPMKRTRGRFLLDNGRTEGPPDGCRKTIGHHSTLIPGIFTLFCVHGVCYGFAVMETSESVNIPFTILRTRFQSGPRVVLYDNACKLHAYALNRDPDFFKETWFLVDRLHWKNHTGCNGGYNMDLYPQFSALNSQVAEQFNSRLKRLKHHLPYMSRENFIRHVKLFLWYHSRQQKKKQFRSIPEAEAV